MLLWLEYVNAASVDDRRRYVKFAIPIEGRPLSRRSGTLGGLTPTLPT